MQRDTWARITCVAIARCDLNDVQTSTLPILIDPDAVPLAGERWADYHLGEFPWHPAQDGRGDWEEPDRFRESLPIRVRPVVAEYYCESGGFDFSVDVCDMAVVARLVGQNLHPKAPAGW